MVGATGDRQKPRQDFLDIFAELARLTFEHIAMQIWHGSAVQHQQIQCPVWHESHRSSESTSLRICVQHALTRGDSHRVIFAVLHPTAHEIPHDHEDGDPAPSSKIAPKTGEQERMSIACEHKVWVCPTFYTRGSTVS
jgi:hypothetical protein